MKRPRISPFRLAALASIYIVTPAMAVVSMDWTNVGNTANVADTTGYGSVGYTYNIGTYDVTNAQYVDFLNAKGSSNSAGIYNGIMGTAGLYGSNITQSGSSGSYSYSVSSTYANMPVCGVTWFDAARFSNWLGNGQGSGSMEAGAYTLNGASSGIITANAGAGVYIPSEDEWYKAAYYNGSTSTYSLFPNGKDTITTVDANYDGVGLVNVSYGTPSHYGTYGQGGNLWQWNDTVSGLSRGLRGGFWSGYGSTYLASSGSTLADPSGVYVAVGFRVASIPEPGCMFLTLLASGILVTRRKR